MKKSLISIICLILTAFMLVSCNDDDIGGYLDQYKEPKKEETLTVNLYMIYEEGTSVNAMTTVRQYIADYTTKNYNTTLNVIYFTAEEYEEAVKNGVQYTATNKADIMLINSQSLMDYMLENSYLAELTTFFEGNTYGTLNASIASSVLDAYSVNGKHFCVPNNYVVGQYEYLLVNRDMAEYFYLGSQEQLNSFTTEESVAELKVLIQSRIDNGEITGTVEDYVRVEFGMYEDKAYWESQGFACNILEYPTVTLADDFSAFAILDETYNVERAMKMLYAINKDVVLHNYLLYGIPHTNYDIEENEDESDDLTYVVRKPKGDSAAYYINPLYAGDIFVSYFCEELGWNEDAAINGELQNKQSIYVSSEED